MVNNEKTKVKKEKKEKVKNGYNAESKENITKSEIEINKDSTVPTYDTLSNVDVHEIQIDQIQKEFKFIDLFAGIGGFHYAMHAAGGKCVFASEWDKDARKTYEHNFRNISPELFENDKFNCDINELDSPEKLNSIPDFNILCAGFPCQPFSHAGLKKGFEDTRGTLFFKIAEIVQHKIKSGKPYPILLLENVKGLVSHDKGNTFKEIQRILREGFKDKDGNPIPYTVSSKVLNAKYFGVPQNRQRIFIVAWPKGENTPEEFIFPLGLDSNLKPIFLIADLDEKAKKVQLSDILEDEPDQKYTISPRLYEGHLRRRREHAVKGNGFGFSLFKPESTYTSTISARYYKDGSEILIDQGPEIPPRKLTPQEAGRLQGYNIKKNGEIISPSNKEKEFKICVSDVQAYRQFGNSVAVPVVESLALEIKKQLLRN